MLKRKIKNNSGFTIIEVMIVLAIAALILLIVLLAVPALQRSARNNSRRADASAVESAVSEYASNNGGSLPAGISYSSNSSQLTLCGTANCPASDTSAQANAKLGYYTGTTNNNATPTNSNVTLYTTEAAPPTNGTNTDDALIIEEGASCLNSTTVQAASSPKANAVVYGVETSGGTYDWECIGS
ncbi:MAG TPA: prepilin-type N-terminal cleavage/methylation domain-containing protein [Candidatus Sulfotelmatobacter sp.]|nr:prepilin-type N-terminal cleavage/methylation domain-containing protein [Candidatus Sulfotelmatobacter sp.]